MKFGHTDAERKEREAARTKREMAQIAHGERWFAWRPVRIGVGDRTGQYGWLEHVSRKRNKDWTAGWLGVYHPWQYQLWDEFVRDQMTSEKQSGV
jgi:hypothetical protein